MNFFKAIAIKIKKQRVFRRIYYSFFFRLILLDFKKNLILLFFWLFLFGMVTNNVAPNYGVAYLFLGPEYFNKISFLSYFIVGFACGGFIMAYNIASFIKNAYRFPFLASLRYPFMKYCLNNFTLPIIFISLYCFQVYFFLKAEETMPTSRIFLMILAILSGLAFFLFIAFSYFFKVNRDIFKLYGIKHKLDTPSRATNKEVITGERNPRLIKESRDWYVETYFSTPTSIRLVRSVKHYKKEILKDVIRKNHHVAFVFQMITIVSLLALGVLGEINAFEIPAGASILLLLTVFIMLFSAFYRWWGGWSIPVFILFLMGLNYMHRIDLFSVDRAFGLNYSASKAEYTYDVLKKMDDRQDIYEQDFNKTLDILNKWKAKNSQADTSKKPKIVFINTSGGGLRSALWTFYTLQYADSLLQGKLLSQTQMISGSSGGMIGAAYLRELYLQKQNSVIDNYHYKSYLTNISNDILNPISFKIATSEWLFPMQSFVLDGKEYPKDRAYAFENRLHENTGNAFKKRLGDYEQPEADATIPMMVFSPSVVNDGRKLLISPQGISYLTQNIKTTKTTYNKLYDAIEYSRFFEKQDASKTMFSSVLRMSATFPYISPIVSLPSEPRIEIMDAGLRDNFGIETTLRFLKTFNDWIAENTSGVVIIQIRDKHKNSPIEQNPSQTLMEALSRPMGSFYSNLFDVQDFNHNQEIQFADCWCKSKVEIIDIQLRNEKTDHISLSWHLTNKEKKKVFASIFLPENQAAIKRITELLQ